MHAIGASQSFPPRANCCSAATPRLTALQILSIFAVAVTVSTAVIVAVFAVIIFLCKTRPRLPHAGTLLVPPACYRTSARIALIPSRADFCQSFDLNDFSPNRLSSCVWVAVAARRRSRGEIKIKDVFAHAPLLRSRHCLQSTGSEPPLHWQ